MDWHSVLWRTLAGIGAVKILYDVIPFLYWVFFSKINLDQFRYGYVLVTGATDGIGKSISREFIKRGFKVILVSRSLEKLVQVKQELNYEYPESEIQIIASDFSESHKNPIKFYSNLHSQIQHFQVSILVNNVGTASVKMVHSEKWENIESMLGLNIYPLTMITHGLIKSFLLRFNETKQKSLVLNIGSLMDESIFPANSVYSATKRYNFFFSEGLRYEYKGKILFACIKPGLVKTKLTEANKTSHLPLSVESDLFAVEMLAGLREGVNHGHWKHKVQGFFLNSAPYFLQIGIVRLLIDKAKKKGLIS